MKLQSIFAVLLAIVLITPSITSAQTSFTPQTEREQQAYLYGQIVYLQQLRDALSEIARLRAQIGSGTGFAASSNLVSVRTINSREVGDNETRRELQGEVTLLSDKAARAWFEYGLDENALVYKSRQSSIRSAFDRGVVTEIRDLEEDERYYYRIVAEDEDDTVVYGNIRNFVSGQIFDDEDFSLEVSDTSIEEGDTVVVDWELPRSEEGTRNWIGLFEIGDDDDDYIDREFIDDDNNGRERFRIDDEGDYEFRLFLDNSFRDVFTSRRVRVTEER